VHCTTIRSRLCRTGIHQILTQNHPNINTRFSLNIGFLCEECRLCIAEVYTGIFKYLVKNDRQRHMEKNMKKIKKRKLKKIKMEE
jgi:hypothetical protein